MGSGTHGARYWFPLTGGRLGVKGVRYVSEGECGLDQPSVGERLREVAEMGSCCRIHLLDIQAQRLALSSRASNSSSAEPRFTVSSNAVPQTPVAVSGVAGHGKSVES